MAQDPTHLVFERPSTPSPGLVRLVFGEEAAADTPPLDIPDTTLQGGGRLTGLRLHLTAAVGIQLVSSGRITGLRLRIAVAFDINVNRHPAGAATSRWQVGTPHKQGVEGVWRQANNLPVGTQSRWQGAQRHVETLRTLWAQAPHLQRDVVVAFEQAVPLLVTPAEFIFQGAARLRARASAAHQDAARVPLWVQTLRYQETLRLRGATRSAFENASGLALHMRDGMGVGLPTARGWKYQHQQAWVPRPGQWQRPAIPPAGDLCYDASLPAHLIFSDPHDASLPARLVFVCERHGPGPDPQPEPCVVVPIRRVYVAINSIILTRVSDGMPLPADGFGMSIDTDSWTWQWSASMQPHLRQYLTPVAGEPVQVQAVINGVPYRLCAESISSDRSFGSARIAVRGRGLGAVLDAPYAPTLNFCNSAALTAQQLVQAALTVNGVGIGWDVDFGLTDWLVPAGAWSHQGNYMSAVTAIASAAGGYVQPHATLQTLRILPRYPVAPWDWASVAPDFALPADVVSIEGIEWTTKPAYNRVHVSGVAQGVLAEATRAGTAGNVVAPMVTDPLITHADAARQRALAVLADTGAQARVTLTLPVLAETGLILPGKFVRYTDGPVQRTGIVRASSVNWSRPTLRQTLQLETHGSD